MEQRKTLVLYGDWLLKKMYYRNNSMVYGIHGQDKCGAFVGFLSTLKSTIDFLNPDKVIVFWDGIHDGFFKYNIYPDLKLEKKEKWRTNDAAINSLFYTNNHQEDAAQLWQQKILLQESLEDLCIRQEEEQYCEAIDLIAQYSLKAREEGEKVFLYGREYDYFQLITDQIYCIIPNKDFVLTEYNFNKIYDYDIENELMLRCFVGSNSSTFRKFKGITRAKMIKYFPELQQTHVNYKEFIQLVEERQDKKKLKLYETILNAHEDLKVNSKLLNLQSPFINKASERIVETLLHSQLDVENRNTSLIKNLVKDRGMAVHFNGNIDEFFSTFDRIKLKEKQYIEQVHEQA